MRSLGIFIIVLLCLLFAHILFLHPTAKGNTNAGFETYVESIPIRGKGEGFMEGIDTPGLSDEEGKRLKAYDGEWSFVPMKAEIRNLQIRGPFGKFNNYYFFDPRISIDYVKFNPYKMMLHAYPEIIELRNLDFNAKIRYSTLLRMLDRSHDNFKPKDMFLLEDGRIQLEGRLDDVHSDVYLIGNLKVNIEGDLEMEVEDVIDFTRTIVRAVRSREKVLNALDLRWKFRLMRIDIELDRAAVNPEGIYIEGGTPHWVNLQLGLQEPLVEFDD